MFHKVSIIGRAGGDPETRDVGDSTVTSVNVATNRKFTKKNGERVEETVWFRVSAWNGMGVVLQKYVAKGDAVHIEGELQSDDNGGPRVWTDRDGNARASFELRATGVTLLPNGGGGGNGGGGNGGGKSGNGGGGNSGGSGVQRDDYNNIPF